MVHSIPLFILKTGEKMKAILIDVVKMEIKEVEFKKSLENIYKLTQCNCVTAPSFDDDHDVIVDDEGLLKQPIIGFFEIYDSDYANVYAGNGLIVGVDNNRGEWKSHRLDVEEVKKHIRFVTFVKIGKEVMKIILK